jgi:hypothetical protein
MQDMANDGPVRDKKKNLWKRLSVQLEGLFHEQQEPAALAAPAPVASSPLAATEQSPPNGEKKENFFKRLSVQLLHPVIEKETTPEDPQLIEVQLVDKWHHKITGFHSTHVPLQPPVPSPAPAKPVELTNVPDENRLNSTSHSKHRKSSGKSEQRGSVIGLFYEPPEDKAKEKQILENDFSELVKALEMIDSTNCLAQLTQPVAQPMLQRRGSIIINTQEEQEKEKTKLLQKSAEEGRKNKP